MKLVALSAAALLATTVAASAAEIGNTGISVGAELDNRYNTDAEKLTMTLTPEVGYSRWGFDFDASTDLTLYNGDEFSLNEDKLPTLDLGAAYGLSLWGLNSEAYVETGYDFETSDMSDVEVGISFSF